MLLFRLATAVFGHRHRVQKPRSRRFGAGWSFVVSQTTAVDTDGLRHTHTPRTPMQSPLHTHTHARTYVRPRTHIHANTPPLPSPTRTCPRTHPCNPPPPHSHIHAHAPPTPSPHALAYAHPHADTPTPTPTRTCGSLRRRRRIFSCARRWRCTAPPRAEPGPS